MLLELAAKTGWQLVASVRDEMVPELPTDRPTLQEVLDVITSSEQTWLTLADGWLTLAPAFGRRVQQLDRPQLELFMEKCAGSYPTLDTQARLASVAPATSTVKLAYPYMRLATGGHNAGKNGWDILRFFDTLTNAQKAIVKNGGTIAIRELSPSSTEVLVDIVFNKENLRLYPKEVIPNGAPIKDVPEDDSTDLLPFGLHPDMVLEFAPRQLYGVFLVSLETPEYLYEPIPISLLSANSRRHARFRIASAKKIAIRIPMPRDTIISEHLTEYSIDFNSPVYTIESAPKDFKIAYEAAVAKRGKGATGTANTRPQFSR